MTDVAAHIYSQGSGGTAVVVGRGAALVLRPADDEIIAQFERWLTTVTPFDDVVVELTAIGIGSLPAFALLIVDDGGVQLLQRGAIEIQTLDLDGVAATLAPPKTSRWREDVLESVATVRLRAVDAEAGTRCWFSAGIVATADLEWFASVDAVAVVQRASMVAQPIAASVADAFQSSPGVSSPAAYLAAASDATASVGVSPTVFEVMSADELAARAASSREPSGSPLAADGTDLPPPSGTPEGNSPSEAPSPDESQREMLDPAVTSAPPSHDPSADDRGSTQGTRAAPSTPHSDVADLDLRNLVDHTMYRHPEDAAIRADDTAVPADPESVAAGSMNSSAMTIAAGHTLMASDEQPIDEADDSDHDGHTVMRGKKSPAGPTGNQAGGGLPGNQVQAIHCPNGHPNIVTAQLCRRCKQPIIERSAVQIPRPQLGVLRFSTNQTAMLDRPIVIGRMPATDPVGGETPTAVVVDNTELSRLHARVYIDGWFVYVEDNDSTNDTSVTPPGHPPQVCKPFQKVPIIPDTVVNLGGVVTFRFDVE